MFPAHVVSVVDNDTFAHHDLVILSNSFPLEWLYKKHNVNINFFHNPFQGSKSIWIDSQYMDWFLRSSAGPGK